MLRLNSLAEMWLIVNISALDSNFFFDICNLVSFFYKQIKQKNYEYKSEIRIFSLLGKFIFEL